MVVDQKLLKSQMMKYDIGSNVRNKISGKQTTTQQTTPTTNNIQTTTPTTNDTYKVITTKFPTYDIKDLMGFSPTNQRNQISLLQNTAQYNNIQQQAQNNTNPNIRYNIQQPQITNKQTLQIQQATPETNEQGLKINKTNSFKDLVIDLQNVANQGRNLEFMKFRELYPEYVENWDKVVDLFESIKSNPQYSAEQVTNTAQKAYPELFGIDDNYSSNDKITALQKLYDEMISNKKNGIQLTQQDIIDRYPEYANTQDINTVMEVQDLINHNKKTPTFNDIAENFEDLIKGNVEVGNTEKEQISKDIKNLENLEARQYNYLSDEGKDYVKLLGAAKMIKDQLREQYYIPDNVSEWDILQELKKVSPEAYNELLGNVSENTQLSEKDRKLLDGGSTLESTGKYFKGNLLEFLVETEGGLGTILTDLGKINNTIYEKMAQGLENATGNKGIFTVDDSFKEGSMVLGEAFRQEYPKLREELESQQWYKEFQEENQKEFTKAIKDGDWTTMVGKSVGLIGQTLPAIMTTIASGGATGAGFAAFLPSSTQRALEDLEADESINLTENQKHAVALLMGSVESAIEEISLNMMLPGLKAEGGLATKIIDKIPGMQNALLRFAVQTELGATSESLEEVMQEFSNNLIAKGVGSDRSMGELKDYWDIFTETFLSSQLISALGGAGEAYDQTQLNNLKKQVENNTKTRNNILKSQAILFDNFNEFASEMEVVPGTTTEELQKAWNEGLKEKENLEKQANDIMGNTYNTVKTPTYERTTVKEAITPKLSAKDSQEYTDILNQMVKDGEITKEQRQRIENELGVYTKNVEQTEQPQTEGLAKVTEQPKTTKKTGWWTKKMSGLDNETITRIENNPYISNYWNKAVKMVEDEGLSMDNGKIIEQPMQELGEELLQKLDDAEKNLGEDGRMYKLIKDIKQQYDLSESRNGIKNTLDKYDISIIDGKLDFSDSQFVKAEDTNAISRAVGLLNNTNLSNITPKEYWNLRKKLSALAGFDKGTSKDGEAVVRQLRHLVDQLAKEKIPGLKKVDEIFSKEIGYLNEIKQGLVYQQGARKGEIKDNFYSILKTINNQNRQQMNQRLEKIMPDLSDRVEAINMLPKLLKAYAVRSRLVELGARNIGKVGGAVTGGIPGLVVGYVFDEISGKVTKSMRKNAINKIVNNMSDTAKQKLEDIATKQDEKESLTQEERDTLNQVKREIEEMNREREKQGIIRDLEAKENQKALPQNTPIAEIGENGPKINKPNTPQPTAKKDIIEINKPQIEKPKPQGLSQLSEKLGVSESKAEEVQESIDDFLNFVGANEEKPTLETTTTADYKQMSTRGLETLLESDKIPIDEANKINEELSKRDNSDTESWDYLDHKFAYEIQKLQEEEQRIGKVGNRKVNKEYTEKQRSAWVEKREDLVKRMGQAYDKDTNRANEKYRELEGKSLSFINEWTRSKKFAVDEAEQEVITNLQENWNKINRFELMLTAEEQEERAKILDTMKENGYEIRTTEAGDSFYDTKNRDNKGAINWGQQVNATSLETLKNSGLYDMLPDDTKIYISGQEIQTLGELKKQPKGLVEVSEAKEQTKSEGLSDMTRQQKVDTKSNFVDFNDVDMSSKHESFGTDVSDNLRQKNPNSAAGVTYYTASKMSDLDGLLRRYGGKGVNSADFVASYTLGELLDNPALYEKYPGLENKLVVFADFHTNKKRGVNFMDTIYINSKIYEKNPGLARSTIVHEIEHEIQKYEGTYVEKSEAYQNANRLGEDYVNDPNEQGAIKKQQEYLDFIGQGTTKIGGLDNTQIKKFAVQQGLAEISNL